MGDATLSYNGSGTFNINTAGQPVVTGTVISSSVFNALTADLATGLSTAITKDGQTTVTNNIPFNGYKITNLGAGTASTDAVRLGQLQAGTATAITVTGTDTYTGTMSPALASYTAGNTFSFVVPNTNTTGCTLNIDGQGAKAITRDGSTALIAGDLVAGSEVVVIYDGTRFQVLNSNSKTNWTVSNALTLSAGTANGVAYLNGSKALTTGSALTFDGTNLGVGTSTAGNAGSVNVSIGAPGTTAGGLQLWTSTTGSSYLQWGTAASGTSYYRGYLQYNYNSGSDYLAFGIAASEQMRLTSTGLGIGTSSITDKLTVVSAIGTTFLGSSTTTNQAYHKVNNASGNMYFGINNSANTFFAAAAYAGIVWHDGAYPLVFGTNNTEKMRLDSSGNLGLGVTPSAWGSNSKAIEGAYGSALSWSTGGAELNIESNAYYNGANWIYKTSAFATLYSSAGYNGKHSWYTAPSGTAGNPISFTQAMTLDASGNLGVGTTSPAKKLDVNGDASINGVTVGRGAGSVSTNTAVGSSALASTSSGPNITSVGYQSLYSNTTGGYSTAIGYQALYSNSSANNNHAFGWQSGYSLNSGNSNLLVGLQSGYGLTSGSQNTFVGAYNTAGSGNGAGSAITTGSKNTILGAYSGNQGGLDIRTASNYIVLSDGDGNPRMYMNGSGLFCSEVYSVTGAATANVYVDLAGNLYRATSSLKYKTNVQNSVHGLKEVLNLRSVTYQSKKESENGITFGGLIAEDVHAAGLTEFVQYAPDGTPDAIAYGNMVSLLAKAIQEQQAIIEQLKADVATLKGA